MTTQKLHGLISIGLTGIMVCATSAKSADERFSVEATSWNDSPYCCCRTTSKTLFRWSSDPFSTADADEEDRIVTDRPDFTEASSTVGKDRFQVEMGYTFTHDDTAGVQLNGHSYPETLFRIGMLADWFELRIAYNFLNEQVDDPVNGRMRFRGSDDLYLGAKLWLTEQSGILPEMAILPQMFVPTGSSSFTNDEVLPGVNWLYSWELNDVVSLAGSTQFNRARDDTGHFYVETAQSVALGIGVSDRLGAYAEYFAIFPSGAVEAGVGPEHFFNGGFAYLLSNDVQFDIRAGMGLNRNAADFFSGAGLSVRY